MSAVSGFEYIDFNGFLRDNRIRFFVVGAATSRVEPNTSLVYGFPGSDYRFQVFDLNRFTGGNSTWAFQRPWAVEKARLSPHIIFDACTLEAGDQFARVNNWPVFMEVRRMLGSSTFAFKQIPIHLLDISGKQFILGHGDPMRSQSNSNLSSRFKLDVLHPMIEAMREDYFSEDVAEAHTTSVQLTRAWLDAHRLATELNGSLRSGVETSYSAIQHLRLEKPKDTKTSPCVTIKYPGGMQACLSANSFGSAPLRDRAKLYFTLELTDTEHTSYSSLKRLITSVQQSRKRDDISVPTAKRRKVIIEDSSHGKDSTAEKPRTVGR